MKHEAPKVEIEAKVISDGVQLRTPKEVRRGRQDRKKTSEKKPPIPSQRVSKSPVRDQNVK